MNMDPRGMEGVRRAHAIHIENRGLMSVTGVKDVGSFNEQEIQLLTEVGALCVEGSNLHITRLNLEDGQVMLEGDILALEYADAPENHGSVFSRLFR